MATLKMMMAVTKTCTSKPAGSAMAAPQPPATNTEMESWSMKSAKSATTVISETEMAAHTT